MNQLAVDAPTGDIEFEEESLTPARYEEYLEVFRQQGRVPSDDGRRPPADR